ncbi:MAG: hypothetical protein KJ661_07550, partial [Candidatus Omnitrophica bacterium]|nr:hypothetical protein [Candidatus Omnitrophota bacterium]
MKKIFEDIIKIQCAKLIIFVIFLAAIIFLIFYYNVGEPKVSVLFGGLATGLIIAGIQLLFSWGEFTEMEKIKRLGIKKILDRK